MAKKRSRDKRDKKRDQERTRRKPCPFCRDKIVNLDYKSADDYRRFMSEKGKIRSRRITGACRRHQSQLAKVIKRSREMALLPYVGGR